MKIHISVVTHVYACIYCNSKGTGFFHEYI